jgi:hypothetical protein
LLYWPNACRTALLHAAGYDFDRGDLACVERAIGKPIKVRSKVALRIACA